MGEIFNYGGTNKLALIAEWLDQLFSCAKSRLLVELPSVHWH